MIEPSPSNGTTPASNSAASRVFIRLKPVMLFLVYIYAGTDIVYPKIGHTSQVIFTIAATILAAWGVRHHSLRFPSLLLTLAIAIQTASWHFAPELEAGLHDVIPRIDRLGRWFLFIFTSYWLIGTKGVTRKVWLCFTIGLLSSPFIIGGGLNEISDALKGERVDFGLRNAQHTGMLFGIAIIGLYSFLVTRAIKHSKRALSVFILSLLLTVCLLGLIASQSRGAWISTGVGLIVCSLTFFFSLVTQGRTEKSKRRYNLKIAATILATALALLTLGAPTERFTSELHTISKFLGGDIETLDNDSVGIRLKSWYSALPWILERPLIGWGDKGSAAVIANSDHLPPHIRSQFGHLHNSYIDIAVQYGASGLAILVLLLIWLFTSSLRAWRYKSMPSDHFIFICGFLAYWTVINLTESFMLYSYGRLVFNLVFCIALAYHPPHNPNACSGIVKLAT